MPPKSQKLIGGIFFEKYGNALIMYSLQRCARNQKAFLVLQLIVRIPCDYGMAVSKERNLSLLVIH